MKAYCIVYGLLISAADELVRLIDESDAFAGFVYGVAAGMFLGLVLL